MKNMTKAQKTALYGILSALALLLSVLENQLIPDIPFLPPGAKIGLSNIITMLTASLSGFSGAMYITLLKGLFALLTRGATAGIMSLSGGVISTAVLCLTLKLCKDKLSFVGIGVLCACFHNVGQLAAACVISGTPMLFHYGKYLLLFAVVTGMVTGLCLNILMPRIRAALRA